MSCDCCVALPHDATGLSAVWDCVISWSYSLTIFDIYSQNSTFEKKDYKDQWSSKLSTAKNKR